MLQKVKNKSEKYNQITNILTMVQITTLLLKIIITMQTILINIKLLLLPIIALHIKMRLLHIMPDLYISDYLVFSIKRSIYVYIILMVL